MDECHEVYRDHFAECLVHFSKWFNKKCPARSRGRSEKLKPLVDFCNVTVQTAQRWVDNPELVPKGEGLIKLTCYLDLHGYRIIEFERLHKVLRNIAEVIGFGVLSAEQVGNIVGYPVSSLYEVYRGDQALTKDKESRIYELWKDKRGELEVRKREAFKSARLEILFKQSSNSVEQQVLTLLKPMNSLASRQTATLAIMRGLLGLLDEGLFSDLSPTELAGFENSDRLRILQLSNHFTVLSSKLIQLEKE